MSFELPPSFWPMLYRASTGGTWPPVSDDAAAPFLIRVVHEGLLSLLLTQDDMPPCVMRSARGFAALDRTNRLRTTAFEQSVRALLDTIADEQIIVFKGIDYAYRLYPAPHLRPRQDVDLLVRRERAAAVAARLKKAGYVQHFPGGAVARVPAYHESIFVIGNATIELHHSFVQRTRNRVDYDGIWRRATAWDGFDGRLLRLDDADAVAGHAINMSNDEFSTPLFRHLDLWLMLRGRDAVLAEAVRRARQWRIRRALYGALRQTSRYFPSFETAAVRDAMRELLPQRVRDFLDRAILPDPIAPRRRAGRMTQLWRKLWLMDAPRFRATFLAYHAYALVAGSVSSARASRQLQHRDEETREHDFEAGAQQQTRGDHQPERRRRIE